MEKAVSSLTEVMSAISNALLVPVLLSVLLCFGWMLILLGSFLRECASRRSRRRVLAELALAVNTTELGPTDVWKLLQSARCTMTGFLVHDLAVRPATPEPIRKRLIDLESIIADSLSRLSFLTRVGPMLGLLGTLIPLGPALTGLSAGNIQQLSSNLVVAFTATVVGLVVSVVAYGIGLVRRSWSGRDLDDLDYIVNRLYPGEIAHAPTA